ncbi:DUF2157 domain-containing protein [Thiosocius teredinicola]|uniref:DUF2157 domain-containing protein n=1 Tax=Thiosocius teredinicola TaxID=1973002 RepID=UPI000990FC16
MRLFRLFKNDTAREVSRWVDDGLIERSQGQAILARYGLSLDDAHGTSFGYYVLTSLATAFFGLALILIVSHNWDDIPRMVRMLGLVGLTLVVNIIGIRYMLNERYRAGTLWLFFGGICYGASIMLIAQIYHLGEHFPDGIYFWALGVLPLVFFTQSRLLALLCLTLATIWLVVERESGFMPYSYPLFALPVLWLLVTRKESVLLFLFAVVGLIVWMNMLFSWHFSGTQYFHFIDDQVPLNVAVGLLLAGVAWWLTRRTRHALRDYGFALHLWLLRALLVLLLVLSFADAWDGLDTLRIDSAFLVPLVIGVCGAAGAWLAWASGRHASGPVLANTLFFVAVFYWLYAGRSPDQDGLAIATNLMLLISGIWLIRRGIDASMTHFFYTGVVVLLLTALFRYFDLIGDYLGGAALFAVAALILFGAARYWHLRMKTQGKGHG